LPLLEPTGFAGEVLADGAVGAAAGASWRAKQGETKVATTDKVKDKMKRLENV